MFVEARLLGGVLLGRLGVNCDGGVDRAELLAFGAPGRLPRNGGNVGLEFAVLPSGRSFELFGLVLPGNGGSSDGGRLGGLEFVRPLVRDGGVVCFGAELIRGVALELPPIGGNLNCPLLGGGVRAGGGVFDPSCEGGLVDFGFC